MRIKNQKGFTLIELMVVVLIIGILAAIGMANYQRVRVQAQESSVKANMHNFQIMMENYATINNGLYPMAGDDAALKATFPGGAYPENPFTDAPTSLIWDADPSNPGEVGVPASAVDGYTLRGHGGSAILSLILSNG